MTAKPDGRLTSVELRDRRTRRRNWAALLVVVLGVAIITALVALMNIVSAHLP